jgi:hypothetical protein
MHLNTQYSDTAVHAMPLLYYCLHTRAHYQHSRQFSTAHRTATDRVSAYENTTSCYYLALLQNIECLNDT